MKSTFCWHVSSRHNNVKPASVFEGLADKLRVCLPPSASMIASVAPPSQRGRREPPHCLRSGSKGRIASTDLPQLSRDRLRTTHYYDIAFEILACGGSGSSGAGFYTCDAARFASGLQYLFMNFESDQVRLYLGNPFYSFYYYLYNIHKLLTINLHYLAYNYNF